MKKKKGNVAAHNSANKYCILLKCLKLGVFAFLFISLLCFSAGCGKTENKNPFNDFTVVSINDIPEELKSAIKQRYGNPFELTYSADGSDLYIIKGYGRQEATEYNIMVKDSYYSKDGLVFNTSLSVPEINDPVPDTPAYPYIIIKTKYIEDHVIFE